MNVLPQSKSLSGSIVGEGQSPSCGITFAKQKRNQIGVSVRHADELDKPFQPTNTAVLT